MSPVIQQARQHIAAISRGIPTNQEVAFRAYMQALVGNVLNVTARLDSVLLDLSSNSFADLTIADLHIRVIRFDGLNHQVLVEETLFDSITIASNEIAEYLAA